MFTIGNSVSGNEAMTEGSIQQQLEKQAGRALIQNAFFRWESALMISGAILLAVFVKPFAGWPWWAWPALGLIGEIAIVASSLTDKNERQRIVEAMFREKYSVGDIHDHGLQTKLSEAEQYRQRIQETVAQQPPGLLRDKVAETTDQVYDWIANMVRLAQRIDAYRRDQIVQRDLKSVPAEIKEMGQRASLERDPRSKDQMNDTLAARQQYLANLQELDGRMQRADLQLDRSLAALGTVYSQILLVGSRDVDSDHAERLRGDVRNEVLALQDLVQSLNEVYSYQTQTMVPASAGDATGQPAPSLKDAPGSRQATAKH